MWIYVFWFNHLVLDNWQTFLGKTNFPMWKKETMNFKISKEMYIGRFWGKKGGKGNYILISEKIFLKKKSILWSVYLNIPPQLIKEENFAIGQNSLHQFQADSGSFFWNISCEKKNLIHSLSFSAEPRKCIWKSHLELYQQQAPSGLLKGESKHLLKHLHACHVLQACHVSPWPSHLSEQQSLWLQLLVTDPVMQTFTVSITFLWDPADAAYLTWQPINSEEMPVSMKQHYLLRYPLKIRLFRNRKKSG